MKYMGSKNRIAKYILPIILANRKPDQWYVEPFVGGANMIDKVDGKRIGGDCNEYPIEALKLIRDNPLSLPKDIKAFSEERYLDAKNNKDCYGKGFVGYCGFAMSYGAMWFSSFRRDKSGKRDYVNESFRSALKQSPKLQDVMLWCHSYNELYMPPSSIIYCDPPYQGTAKYRANEESFDHATFWQWCRDMAKDGHQVFISEYNAPGDFECVWQKEINSSLAKNTGSKKGIEKLFICKGLNND